MGLSKGAFTVTENISSEILSLPMGPHLSAEEALFCIKKIKEFF
jgi:dTDP-4-amino-4,6-dideoxygalactose transaminase